MSGEKNDSGLHGHNQIMSDCAQSVQDRLQPRILASIPVPDSWMCY